MRKITMRTIIYVILTLAVASPAFAEPGLSGALKTLSGIAAPAAPAGKEPEKAAAEAAPVSVPKADFAELQPDLSAIKVQKVIDPLTLLTTSGAIYKLSGIDIPENSDIAVAALKELTTLLTEQDIKVYLTRDEKLGRQNRLGQTLAQIERKKDALWIEGHLLANGLARVRTTAANPEMAKPMLALEDAARAQKLGLWADAQYAILTPAQAAEKKNSFQIIEGEIFNVAQKNNETFLNFEQDWKKDFTIGVSPELRRDLSRRNMNFLSLAHKKVRVRGWVEDRNGPFISLDHGQQLELLNSDMPSLQEPVKPQNRSFKTPDAPEMKEVTEPEAPAIEKPALKMRKPANE